MRSLADLARTLKFRAARRSLPGLVLLTDEIRLPDPLAAVARLPAGSWVILRHYGDPQREALARSLAKLCRAKRLVLLVAGDFRLAVANGAGLHLPEGLVRQARPGWRLWKIKGRAPLTIAAHSRLALHHARRAKADAALLSPVFPTNSHPGAKALGALRFRQWARGAAVPVYALGGINASTARGLSGSGAAGLAAIGGLV